MREIALDTETTGFDPAVGHRIVEIGCVEMINRIKTGEVFHIYLNPERDMPEEAFKVHGLSSDFLKDKPLFSHVVEDFLAFLGNSSLVIHNATFDMKFINAELKKVQCEEIAFERAIDTVLIARKKFPGSPANLDALCRRFDIDLTARTRHGALLDAELLADVYLELFGGRQSHLSLQTQNRHMEEVITDTPQKIHPKRDFPPSEAELAAHKTFMNTIKETL